jgi:hypothetical protein
MIDDQIQHYHSESLPELGAWLARHTSVTQKRGVEAKKALAKCGVSDEVLRREWHDQVYAQTRPLPREYSPQLPLKPMYLISFKGQSKSVGKR